MRLGLVLSEIGQQSNIEVSEQELQRALYEQVRRYPGQEKQIYDFFKSNPDAVAGLRADSTFVIIGNGADAVRAHLQGQPVTCVLQEPQHVVLGGEPAGSEENCAKTKNPA